MFVDSIIVDSNGVWRDEPLCTDRRDKLARIHGYPLTLNPEPHT